jgi:uncharacterized protein (UPF0548 family)
MNLSKKTNKALVKIEKRKRLGQGDKLFWKNRRGCLFNLSCFFRKALEPLAAGTRQIEKRKRLGQGRQAFREKQKRLSF